MLTLLSLVRPDLEIRSGRHSRAVNAQLNKRGNKIDASVTQNNEWCPGDQPTADQELRCRIVHADRGAPQPAGTADIADVSPKDAQKEQCSPDVKGNDAFTGDTNASADIHMGQEGNKETSQPGGGQLDESQVDYGPNPYARYANNPNMQANYGHNPPPGYSVQEGYTVPYQNPQAHIVYVIPPQEHAYNINVQSTQNVSPGTSRVYMQEGIGPYGEQAVIVTIRPFDDPIKRAIFVRRTYSIVFLQLLIVTAAVCCTFFIFDNPEECAKLNVFFLCIRKGAPVKQWLITNVEVVFIFLFLYLACIILMCMLSGHMLSTNCLSVTVLLLMGKIRVLLLFSIPQTISMAGMVSVLCVTKGEEAVLLAAAATSVVVFVLTVVACCCRYDFTKWHYILTVVFLIVVLFGILTVFLYQKIPILRLVYAGIGTLCMCMYIIIDTQMIMGNKKYELDTGMYIFGAITLFLDIIMLFLYILELIQESK